MNLQKFNIEYNKAIENWDEGLPLGNGRLGSIIYGDNPLNVAIDRVDLWDFRENEETFEKGFTYKNLIKLAKSDDPKDAVEQKRLFDGIYRKPTPTKLNAGRLEFNFKQKLNNISSKVDIQNAIAFVYENKQIILESFISANKPVGVLKIYAQFDYDLHIPKYFHKKPEIESGFNENTMSYDFFLEYPETEIIKKDGFLYYKQDTHTDDKFSLITLRRDYENYSEVYYTVATSYDDGFIDSAKKLLTNCADIGYEKLKAEHVKWWAKYWKKSDLSVKDNLIEKTYYRSMYLFASCSRKGSYPMALQGVWTADNDLLPPWKGDYHHDTNTELSYQSYLKANRLPEGEVFIDYIWSMRKTFFKFTRKFYQTKGLLIPACSSLDGQPLGGWEQYSYSPTMTIWVIQSFEEYYNYTGDKKFLLKKAYPMFRDVERAFKDLLIEENGKLYLPLSSSPEIFDNTKKAWLKPNSNFDLALLKYLYVTLIKFCKILGIDGTYYQQTLEKFDDFAVYEDDYMGKLLMLNKDYTLEESHRHFSHLMCLYPLHLINYDTEENRNFYNSNIINLERLGTGRWVGFSFGMAAQIYAMALNGNSAYEKLFQFSRAFVADNGFHLNGDFKNYGYSWAHYRPFTLESSFCYCDALQEMLMQDHLGYIHLFPAIPEDWKDRPISFNKFRSYGGLLVSAVYKDNKTIKLSIVSKEDKTIKIFNNFGTNQLSVENNNAVNNYKCKDIFFEINIKKGKNTFII